MNEQKTNPSNEERKQDTITNNSNLVSSGFSLTSLSSNTHGLTSINDNMNYKSSNIILTQDDSGFRSQGYQSMGTGFNEEYGGGLLNRHNEYGGLLNEHGGLMDKHGGLINKHGRLINKHNELLDDENLKQPELTNEKQKQRQPQQEIKRNLQIWNGPLSQFTTFKSTCEATKLSNEINSILKKMCNEGKIDFTCINYEFYGRMYSKNDISEFQIQLYKNNDVNDTNTKTILEIRRTSGDSFVHDELFSNVSTSLINQKFIIEENNKFLDDFNGLTDLSFNNMSLSDDDDDDEIDLDITTDDNDVDTISNSNTSNNNEWTDDLIDTLKNRESYRDTWRHSATQLCNLLDDNNQILNYVSKKSSIIDNILIPISSDLYDCLIIRSVLEIINKLLTNGVKPANQHFVLGMLINLRNSWTVGPTRQLGPLRMTFTKSQQIVNQCDACIAKINS